MIRPLFISVMLLVGAPSLTLAASFDCDKAATETEIAICADPELSALDELMSNLYIQALKYNDWYYPVENRDDSELIDTQRLAIMSQIQCGRSTTCLLEFYISRISDILTNFLYVDVGYNEADTVTSLLNFSSEITPHNSIRDLAAASDGSVEVLMVSEGNAAEISRGNTGTVYDYNPIKIIISYTNLAGQLTQQVIEVGAGQIALGATLEVTSDKFIINESHTRGFSTSEYELSWNGKWELTYANSVGVTRPGSGLIVNRRSDYQAGIEYATYSFVFSECEIVEQPYLIGDNSRYQNYDVYREVIDYQNTREAITKNIALNNFIDDRDLREFSFFAFSESEFELAKLGFELLASQGYPQSAEDLECVKFALTD